jgi:hypothetical protein
LGPSKFKTLAQKPKTRLKNEPDRVESRRKASKRILEVKKRIRDLLPAREGGKAGRRRRGQE